MSATQQSHGQRSGRNGQSSFATEFRRYDRMFARFGRGVLDAADLTERQRVVEVGCGAGTLSLDAAQRVGPMGRVVGVDIASAAVAVARDRARRRRLTNVRFVVADAASHGFPKGRIDAIVSRFGSCSFEDPKIAFGNLRPALRPGGALVFVCAREASRNPWATVPERAVRRALGTAITEAPRHKGAATEGGGGPFRFSDETRIRRDLLAAGFRDITLESVDDTVCVGDDVDEALEFFFESDGRALADRLPDESLKKVSVALREALAPYAGKWGVYMPASAWLVRARA